MEEDLKSWRRSLVFYINGKKVVDDFVDPEWTLLRYIRKRLNLTGTKNVCSEGGCGACTVMVSKCDQSTDQILHYAVNACITPVCCVDGKAVTTVEGVGSVETKLHPVQERLALAHGSQCGFCTPGFVMSMYALLRNNPTPSMEEIEEYLVGNLCRCTGYRPILEGLRTFASSENIKNNCGRSDCCRNQNGNECEASDTEDFDHDSKLMRTAVLFDKNALKPYDDSQDLIFPPDLKLVSRMKLENLFFNGPRVQFYRPVNLKNLLTLKRNCPHAKLIGGNTEIGIEVEYKNRFYPVLIDISNVPELLHLDVQEQAVVIGAGVSLSTIERRLLALAKEKGSKKPDVTGEMLQMLKYFAGRQIRNVATLGGNIMTGSPISDLNPIFMAAGASLNLRSMSEERKIALGQSFYSGYRKNITKPDEVLISIEIPFSRENEYFRAYKQARRREDDIAIVNAAFRVAFEPQSQVISGIRIAFGGMAPTTVMALKTMEKLEGRRWSECLEEGLESLHNELKLHPSAPGGMVEYRSALVLSFFFKFHLEVRGFLQSSLLIPENPNLLKQLSSIKPFKIPNPQSMQFFQEVHPLQPAIDPVGRPYPTISGFKQTTGEAFYVDDIPEIAGELHAAFVLSSRAYAKILGVDTSEALKLRGVQGIFTAKDIPDDRNVIGIGPIEDEQVFASDKVNCVGQVVGMVVAEDASIARRAAQLVKVEYEDIPNPIITIKDAIEASSFFGDPWIIHRGDLEKGFTNSPATIEGQFYIGGQEHFYLETNSHIAVPKDADEMEIFTTTQCLVLTQDLVAKVLEVPASKVVCRIKRLGGAFGGKESRTGPLAAALAFVAKKTRRPVRLVLNRHEDMLITGTRHPMFARWKVGFEDTGRILCLEAKVYSNCGWSVDLSYPVMQRAIMSMDNGYRIENVKLSGFCCKTNLPSNTAFRGFGGPQGMAFMEDILSKIADFLHREPTEVREINFYKTNGDCTHLGIPLENCNIRRCWEEVIQSSNYYTRKAAIQEFNQSSSYKKRGICAIPTKFGISFTATFLNQAGALVHIYKDGSVLVSHGGTEMGQGLHTKMIQVTARALSISKDRIHIAETSTDKVPNTSATAASASSDLNGMAIIDACEKINQRLKPYKEKDPTGSFEKWVTRAYFDRVSLSAAGFYATPGIEPFNFETQRGRCFSYFTYGAAVSEVEVDCLTGDHWTIRSDIVMDLGNSLNPAIDIGQIEGAFAQGIGLFTLEEIKYFPDGTLFTRGPGAYKIPGSHDIPRVFNVSLLKDSSNPRAVYSSKAVGEPPLFLASSVFFAIKDAIKSYRKSNGKDDYFEFDSPATAEDIRMASLDGILDKIEATKDGSAKPWFISVK